MDGFGTTKQNAKVAKKLGIHTLGISDHGNISAAVEHITACKGEKLRYAVGVELYISRLPACIKAAENRSLEHMVCFAKNKNGWKQLVKLTNKSNDPEYFYYKPRIAIENYIDKDGVFYPGIEHFVDGNIVFINGHQGSRLSNILWCNPSDAIEKQKSDLDKAYAQYKGVKSPDYYKQFLNKNWLENCCNEALRLQKLLGKDTFFIELQNELNIEDKTPLFVHPVIVDCLREVSKKTGIPTIASSDPHYPTKEDAEYQRILVMTNLKQTEETVKKQLEDADNLDTMIFFGSNNFYIHSYDEMSKKFTEEELANTVKLSEQIEQYNITENPYIPKFDIPDYPRDLPHLSKYKNDSDRYLMHLCVDGAKKLKPWLKSQYKKEKYWERLQSETDIIFKIGLSDYFLVVDDICKAADNKPENSSFDWRLNLKNNGKISPIARGIARGSAAGCLISYFTGITGIDPVQHDLLFSRFFNAGRMSEGNISLPDIDLDFETGLDGRDWIIEYIRWKYGANKTAQILTFASMKGKGAIKDVFRVKGVPNHFDIANKITQCIAEEAAIADDIQEMKEGGDETYNILRWSLDNIKEFQEYYSNPEYKDLIDIAIKCEGVRRGTGRHPSGIVISNQDLNENFPMCYDTKSKEKIVGVDLKSAEKLGIAKFDILGVAVLSKLKMCQNLYNNRKC